MFKPRKEVLLTWLDSCTTTGRSNKIPWPCCMSLFNSIRLRNGQWMCVSCSFYYLQNFNIVHNNLRNEISIDFRRLSRSARGCLIFLFCSPSGHSQQNIQFNWPPVRWLYRWLFGSGPMFRLMWRYWSPMVPNSNSHLIMTISGVFIHHMKTLPGQHNECSRGQSF